MVAWAREAYRLSERRACQVFGANRSSVRYQSQRQSRDALRRRLKELAAVRVSWGYKRLHVLLRREGWRVNHKLVYRLYKEERLALKRKRPKRRKSAVPREVRPLVTRPNERWAMEASARRAGQRPYDPHSHRSRRLPQGNAWPWYLRSPFVPRMSAVSSSEAGERWGKLPELISVDNGTEFTSKALDHWSYWNRVRLDLCPSRQANGQCPHRSVGWQPSA